MASTMSLKAIIVFVSFCLCPVTLAASITVSTENSSTVSLEPCTRCDVQLELDRLSYGDSYCCIQAKYHSCIANDEECTGSKKNLLIIFSAYAMFQNCEQNEIQYPSVRCYISFYSVQLTILICFIVVIIALILCNYVFISAKLRHRKYQACQSNGNL